MWNGNSPETIATSPGDQLTPREEISELGPAALRRSAQYIRGRAEDNNCIIVVIVESCPGQCLMLVG